MAKRLNISALKNPTLITLKFHGSKRLGNEPYELDALFLEGVGTGEEARARFQFDGDPDTIFEAYKYNGHWAYGTSAERLSATVYGS